MCCIVDGSFHGAGRNQNLDGQVLAALRSAGFTGTIQSQFSERLGRPLDPQLANLGRLLWFDKSGGLHDDNTCGGCHSPSRAFGDTQSIAIGVQNNNVVGPHRTGPRNQRRTPFASNTPFYPNLMWNGRFAAISGNPFDNSLGFRFPLPEGTTRFPPNDPIVTHLSIAQAHMPPTELVEVAGFTCTAGTIGPAIRSVRRRQRSVSPSGRRNRQRAMTQSARSFCNGSTELPAYRQLFGATLSVSCRRRPDRLLHVCPRHRGVRIHAHLRRRAGRSIRTRRSIVR